MGPLAYNAWHKFWCIIGEHESVIDVAHDVEICEHCGEELRMLPDNWWNWDMILSETEELVEFENAGFYQ